MKPLILPNNKPPESPKISIQDAERMAQIAAERAATQAAERVSHEAMNSFDKFQQNNLQQNNSSQQIDETNDVGDVDVFDKTTANSMSKTVRAFKAMQDVFQPPPDPIRGAMENAVGQLATRFAENVLLGGANGTQVAKKSSFLIDVLNTAAAHGFGEALGGRMPEVIQSLTSSLGERRMQELADNVNSKISVSQEQNNSNNSSVNNSNVNNSSDVEKQKDMVLALDINNLEHIKQYAHAMGLSEKAARGMLQIHQDDIRTERKNGMISNQGNVGNQVGNQVVSQVSTNDIAQALTVLIQEMSGMKETMNTLNSKIVDIEGKRIPDKSVSVSTQPVTQTETDLTDSKWEDENGVIPVSQSPVSVSQKSVRLFNEPVKVDVDSIQGNSDPFFTEPKRNSNDNVIENSINKKEKMKEKVEKESILEEVKDVDGNSTFVMSNKKETIRKEQSKEQSEPIIQTHEKVTEKEEDKKKVDLDELINENDVVLKNTEPKIEETKTEETKVERKRIVRRQIKEEQESPSSIEHYDINNNLINEV